MKNTELFNFKFVNRINERETLSKFLNNEMESNILWINGSSGVGKTYFIEKNVLNCKKEKEVIVYLTKIGETSVSYLSQFINILSQSSYISFFEFIKSNYISIFDMVKKVTINVLVSNSINDFGLVENGFDLTKQFLSKNKERHNAVKVIDNYLKYISKKCKVITILDNFTVCDEESLDVLTSIFYNHQTNKNLQFIIITTAELLKKRLDILTLLSEKIDVTRISIHAFKNSTYFFDILSDLFDLHQCEWDDIKHLYNVCNGLPQKLKIFLMNLYAQNGINYQNDKAIFAYDKLKNLLQQELIDFDFDFLSKEQKYILRLVTEWGLPIELTLLESLSKYISNIDITLQEFTDSVLRKALLDLESISILEKTYENNTCQIKVKHDSIFYATNQLLRKNLVKSRFIHFCMFQFIEINHNMIASNVLSSLRAYHSYLAKADNWYEINIKYGLSLSTGRQYIKAQKVLDRLSEYIHKLEPAQKLAIALNAYNAGEFEKADSILNLAISDTLNTNEFFLLQTTKCRIFLMLLDYKNALFLINQLLEMEINSAQQLEVLYLKEVALCLAPHGYADAKQLFENIVKHYQKSDGIYWMERIYRTAMDYYRGDTSKKYLGKALAICKILQDEEELAKATHNLGFECFRCGEYEEALQYFQDCQKILENIKPHETSYCLNNIATIYIVKKEYCKALDELTKADFWNKSDYAAITIKGNKMLCYHYLNQTKECEHLQTELLKFVDTSPFIDDKIYKKIYTNLAVIAISNKENASAELYLRRCLPYLKTETPHSSARVKKLLNELSINESNETHLNCYQDYYQNLPFEPWVLTFGNE